jgi:hypothetical protein
VRAIAQSQVFAQKVVRSFKLQSAIDVDLNGIDGMAIERTGYEMKISGGAT